MHIFILGGNSLRNKGWAYSLQKTLSPLADAVIVHEYAHWTNGEQFINLDTELKSLAAALPAMDDYILVAKSMGAVLAAKGIHQKSFKPAACILMGIPLREVRNQSTPFREWLSGASCSLVYIQNDHDPLGSFSDVKKYLQGIATDSQLHMLPGETHDYVNFDEIKRLVVNDIGFARR